MPNADKKSIQLVRNDIVKGLTIQSINSNDQSLRSAQLTNGDFVSVPKANLEFTNAIRVLGAINSPQLVSLAQKQMLSTIVSRAALLNNTDLNYGLIVRRAKFDEHTTIIQFSPSDVINGDFDSDLKALDEVLFFNRVSFNSSNELERKVTDGNLENSGDDSKSIEAEFVQKNELESFTTKQFLEADKGNYSRKKLLAPIIARLKGEASEGRSVQLIEVVGQVKFPGVYPIATNNSLANTLRAAGGLSESAYLQNAEITSTSYDDSFAVTEHKPFNLMTQLALGESDQIKLTSKDVLNIVQIPDWYESNVVTLSGEVIFPGTYQISNGETLKSLLKRAGGLTKEATIEAAVFTRIELQKKEQSTIKQAVEDLREQLANNNLSNSQFSKIIDYDNATKVLNDLENTKPIGRLVIDLNGLLNGQMLRDIELKGGDNLVIPNITPAVSVIGEVFVTATHWYDPTLSIADYISKAGGVREYGDASKVYIVKADGSVFIPESSFWFTTSNKVNLTPGDTIVVPRDVTNYDNISLWQGVTQIVYQSAVALAAIGSL
jgi:protein involved in polysaccharide export with SLBB domain